MSHSEPSGPRRVSWRSTVLTRCAPVLAVTVLANGHLELVLDGCACAGVEAETTGDRQASAAANDSLARSVAGDQRPGLQVPQTVKSEPCQHVQKDGCQIGTFLERSRVCQS
jgi:hypothetical protein